MRFIQARSILLLLLITFIGVQAAPAGVSLKRRIQQGRELFEKAAARFVKRADGTTTVESVTETATDTGSTTAGSTTTVATTDGTSTTEVSTATDDETSTVSTEVSTDTTAATTTEDPSSTSATVIVDTFTSEVTSTSTEVTTATTIEEPSTSTEATSASTVEEPSTSTEATSASTAEEPSTTTAEEPSTSTEGEPTTSSTEEPSTSTEEPTTTSEEPSTSTEEPTTTSEEVPSSSISTVTITSTIEEPTSTESSFTETKTTHSIFEPPEFTNTFTDETSIETASPTRPPTSSVPSRTTRSPSPHPPGPTTLDACDNTLNYFYLAGSCQAVATYYEWMEEEQSLALVPAGITTDKIRGFCQKLPGCLGGKIPKTVKKIYENCKQCRADYHQIIFLAGNARTWYLLCQRDQNNFYIGDILSWGTSFFRTKVFLTMDDIAQLQPAKPRICSGKQVSAKVTKAIKLWLEIASEALNNTPLLNSANEVITVYNRLTRGLNTLCGSDSVPPPQNAAMNPFPNPMVGFP